MSKLRSKKTLAVASAALAVAGGGGAAIALAQGSGPSPQAFFDSVAKHLGVSSEELEDATNAAALEQVDAALEAGTITQEQADALKARIEAGKFPFFGPGLFGPRLVGPELFGGPHEHAHVFLNDHFSAAAAYLGLTVEQLRERLGDGQSLADVAEAEGKSVDGLKQAIVADAKKELDEAVSDDRLTQDEADALLERLESHIDDFVDATFRVWRGGGRLFGPDPDSGPFWEGAAA